MHQHNDHETEAAGATLELGAAMRFHRVASGVSLRTMARRLGFSGHSHLADYERGRRLPCKEIVAAYEQTLDLPAGQLGQVHDRALAERAERVTAELLADENGRPDETADTPVVATGTDGTAHANGNDGGADPSYEIELIGDGSIGPVVASGPAGVRLRVRLVRPDTVQLEIMFASGDGTPRP